MLLSFGHGYSAAALARVLRPKGWDIIGTTRCQDKADRLRSEGITPRLWGDQALTADLDRATHILVSTGPDADGDPVLRHYHDQIAAQAHRLTWVGYLSTTGVYGDHQGDWVDETTPLTPSTRRGMWRLEAETAWQTLARDYGLPLHIFRLAGIYGPGRGPFAKVRAGTARRILKPGQVFSRIHVADIAQVLAASINRPNPGGVYNVCDDFAAPPEDVIAHAADLLGVPRPPEIPIDQADMTPMAHSFYAENKRVRNDKIKQELGVSLRFPDYKRGLAALLEADPD